MTYILIIFFGFKGGIGVAEFNSMQACESAAVAITKKIDPKFAGGVDAGSMICVAKGKQ